ncbi:DNA replication licensing factor Mcm2, partial [Kipferlia bialata]
WMLSDSLCEVDDASDVDSAAADTVSVIQRLLWHVDVRYKTEADFPELYAACLGPVSAMRKLGPIVTIAATDREAGHDAMTVDSTEADMVFEEEDDREAFEPVDLSDWGASVADFLARTDVQRTLYVETLRFLNTYVDPHGRQGDRPKYEQVLSNTVQKQSPSLPIDYEDLAHFDQNLASLVADAPAQCLAKLDEAAERYVFAKYPDYADACQRIIARPFNLPFANTLRGLRRIDLGKLIRLKGVVTRRSPPYPSLLSIKLRCTKCQHVIGPIPVATGSGQAPSTRCDSCGAKVCIRVCA